MPGSIPKDVRRWVKIARKAGWTVELTKDSHVRWLSPNGGRTYTSGSPSDGRGRLNARSELRRLGLDI